MLSITKNITTIIFIALGWIFFEAINRIYFDFLKISDSFYLIYWLSGLRLVAILLFEMLGFYGLFLGYVIGTLLFRNFSTFDALCLGFLTSLAPLLAYKIWIKYLKGTAHFYNFNFTELCYLVFLHSILTAIFRNAFFFLTNKLSGLDQILTTFTANVIGTFLFLYILKISHRVFIAITVKK